MNKSTESSSVQINQMNHVSKTTEYRPNVHGEMEEGSRLKSKVTSMELLKKPTTPRYHEGRKERNSFKIMNTIEEEENEDQNNN